MGRNTTPVKLSGRGSRLAEDGNGVMGEEMEPVKQYDFTEIEKHCRARIQSGILPGAVLAVTKNGKRVYDLTVGYRDVEQAEPLCANGIFRLASMTKPITAAAVLLCEDKGWLSTKDSVAKYLPSFSGLHVGKVVNGCMVDNGPASPMTIEHILSHSSGLCSGCIEAVQYPLFGHQDGKGLAETVEGYPRFLLEFDPGSSESYSGTVAFDVVARIVELVSGMEYEEFLKRYFFEPLDMPDTGYSLNSEQKLRLAVMYRLSNDRKEIFRVEFRDRGFASLPAGYPGGGAGLFSTLEDYLNFADMLLERGVFHGNRILSECAVLKMSEPRHPLGLTAGITPYFNWGYGVRVVSKKDKECQPLSPGSFGWSGAYATHFWIDPSEKLTAVYLTNLDNSGGAGADTAIEFERDVMRAIDYSI